MPNRKESVEPTNRREGPISEKAKEKQVKISKKRNESDGVGDRDELKKRKKHVWSLGERWKSGDFCSCCCWEEIQSFVFAVKRLAVPISQTPSSLFCSLSLSFCELNSGATCFLQSRNCVHFLRTTGCEHVDGSAVSGRLGRFSVYIYIYIF